MDITPFDFNGKEVRAITGEDGSVWLVAKDVCDILELTNPTEAIRALDDDEKSALSVSEVSSNGVEQRRSVNIISESGLYKLTFRSNKPEAKAFTKWVTAEVLPAIRKTGVYVAPKPSLPAIEQIPVVSKAHKALVSMAKSMGLSPNQAALSAAQSLRANYQVDVMGLLALPGLESPGQERHLTPTEIGKQFGQSGRAINLALAEQGFQFKGEDGEWRPTDKGRPYAVYLDTTKKHHNGTPIQQLRWLESVTTLIDIEHRPPLELVAGK